MSEWYRRPNPDKLSDVGKRIYARMDELGIRRADVLPKMNYNDNAIYVMAKKGNKPRIDTISVVADVLDTSVDYLLCRTDDSTNYAVREWSYDNDVKQRVVDAITRKYRSVRAYCLDSNMLDCNIYNLDKRKCGARASTLCKIADDLGVTVDYLCMRVDEE